MTDVSEIARAKDRVQATIEDAAASGRFPAGAFQIVDEENRGHRCIVIRRTAHHSEGTCKSACHLGHDYAEIAAGEGSLRFIRRFTERLALLHDRDRAIAAAGCDPKCPPSWSFDAHIITLGMLAHMGEDASSAAPLPGSASVGISGRTSNLQSMINTRHNTTAEILHYRSHLSVRRLTIVDDADRTSLLLHDIADDGPTLIVKAGHLPETLINTMAGLPLGRVVSHPALQGASHLKIRSASGTDGLLKLAIAQERKAIVEAPTGVDTSWRCL